MMKKISTIVLFLMVSSIGLASAATPDWVLPNSKVTPGALNPNVTQANIKDNICKANWTGTVRPPVTYTNKLKASQLATTYASFTKIWGTDPSGYEEDHLISLQLGGSPTDPKNLFPQPYAGNNAHRKDVVETKLKTLICSGKITLADAQKAISKNWVTAYNKYVTAADAAISNSNG
jgi:hypothetical protein